MNKRIARKILNRKPPYFRMHPIYLGESGGKIYKTLPQNYGLYLRACETLHIEPECSKEYQKHWMEQSKLILDEYFEGYACWTCCHLIYDIGVRKHICRLKKKFVEDFDSRKPNKCKEWNKRASERIRQGEVKKE